MAQGKRIDGKDLALIAALSLIAFLFHFWILTGFGLMPGVDGPYYLIQVESILSGEGMVYGDPPLVFYLTALASRVVGDVSSGVLLTVSAFCGLSAAPTYALVKKLTGSRIAGSAAAISLAFSPQIIRMAGDLMKNASGIAFLMSGLFFLHSSTSEDGREWLNAAMAVISAYLAFLTHSLDFAFLLLFFLAYILLCPLTLRPSRRAVVRLGTALTALAVATLITTQAAPDYFTDINKGFAFIRDLLSSHEPAPPMGGLKPKPVRPWPSPGFLDLGYMLPFAAILALLAIDYWGKRDGEPWGKSGEFNLAMASLAAAVVAIVPQALMLVEWAWRFALMGCVPVSIAVGLLVSRLGGERLAAAAVAVALIMPGLLQVPIAVDMISPTIDPIEYEDLVAMSHLVPEGSAVMVACKLSPYWVEYLLGVPLERHPQEPRVKSKPDLLIWCPGEGPPPPPNARVIFRGKRLVLMSLGP